ncbi:hypothetical protein JOF40_001186 [Aeromicrobium fastidiosum]|nr:hypothetical protein [Aeromicrobium fastidiosum]
MQIADEYRMSSVYGDAQKRENWWLHDDYDSRSS